MSDLDSLLDGLASNTASAPPAKSVTAKGDYEDTLDSDDEGAAPKIVAKKYAAPVVAVAPGAVGADDLDDLVADLERQERRRLPAQGGLQVIGARKTTTRKQVKGAIDGDDLERIVDEINGHARRQLQSQQATDQLGFGVINAERKFDLRAPKSAIAGSVVECTLYVYTQSGERSRIPPKHLSAAISGSAVDAAPLDFVDQRDGSYTCRFKVPRIGNAQLRIEAYGKKQFEWPIEILGAPDASQCTAEVVGAPLRVQQTCSVVITARDQNATQLKVGGAQFALSFAGAGQLGQVGLVDRLDGSYLLQFVPDKVGQYAIFISLDGVDIKTHPLVFNVVN